MAFVRKGGCGYGAARGREGKTEISQELLRLAGSHPGGNFSLDITQMLLLLLCCCRRCYFWRWCCVFVVVVVVLLLFSLVVLCFCCRSCCCVIVVLVVLLSFLLLVVSCVLVVVIVVVLFLSLLLLLLLFPSKLDIAPMLMLPFRWESFSGKQIILDITHMLLRITRGPMQMERFRGMRFSRWRFSPIWRVERTGIARTSKILMKLHICYFGCFTWTLNRYQSQLSKTNSVVREHNTRVMPSLLDQLQAGARWVEHSLRLVLPTTTTLTMPGFSERGCLCCAKDWPATWGRSRRCLSSLASARRRSLGGCMQG